MIKYVMILFLLVIGNILYSQTLSTSIENIPKYDGIVLKQILENMTVYKFYREEIYNKFSDKSRIGNKYKLWSLKFRQINQYDYCGEVEKESQKCYEYYMQKLGARKSQFSGPVVLGKSDEIDISGLKDNEFSEVVFFPSDFGGGYFEWYYLSDNQLHRFSVTIGFEVFLLEEIYKYNPDIEIPHVEGSGFPKYENAFFDALNSLVYPAAEGISPQMNEMVFYTQDDISEVIKFYELALGQNAQKSEVEEKWFFSKKRTDLEFYYWPSLMIEEERFFDRETTKEYITKIVYYYPN